MARIAKNSTQFKKDVKLMKKRGKNLNLLKIVMNDLINNISLDSKYKDHPLIGNYQGRRECHLEPDWLLIYKESLLEIVFERTGSHSDLFSKLKR